MTGINKDRYSCYLWYILLIYYTAASVTYKEIGLELYLKNQRYCAQIKASIFHSLDGSIYL